MRPAAILAVVTDMQFYDCEFVMERGSGNSTVFAARLLAQRGSGGIVALEHLESWAMVIRRLLKREGLTQWAPVIPAPLIDGWYEVSKIPAAPRIDLLVVDRPPAWERHKREARRPALDHFAGRLTEDATVILDDAWRPAERRVINLWTRSHGRRFQLDPAGFGIFAPHTP